MPPLIPFTRGAAGVDNPLGIHAGLWVSDWSPASARYAIEGSAAAGYQLIEIPLRDGADPATASDAFTRKLLDDNGLDAVVSLALGPDDDINGDGITSGGTDAGRGDAERVACGHGGSLGRWVRVGMRPADQVALAPVIRATSSSPEVSAVRRPATARPARITQTWSERRITWSKL